MISVATEKPLAAWTGKDRYQGEVLPSLTIIFKSGGCAWRQCLMCSYCSERYPAMDSGELATRIVRQFAWVRANYNLDEYPMVKLYTSGSFFDPDEVPDEARSALAGELKGKLVIAETRPETKIGAAGMRRRRMNSFRVVITSCDRPSANAGMRTDPPSARVLLICQAKAFSSASIWAAARIMLNSPDTLYAANGTPGNRSWTRQMMSR